MGDEDAAADVGVDQALAPARRVLGVVLLRLAEPLVQEAEVAGRRKSVGTLTATSTASVAATGATARRVARQREHRQHEDAEIEAEQARERGGQDQSDPARDAGDDRVRRLQRCGTKKPAST